VKDCFTATGSHEGTCSQRNALVVDKRDDRTEYAGQEAADENHLAFRPDAPQLLAESWRRGGFRPSHHH
jgi:hypothetical protein